MAKRREQGVGDFPSPAPATPSDRRRRLLGGAALALSRHGYAEMTVEQVLVAAGVSRTTFYDNFTSKRECVLFAHEEAFAGLLAELFDACADTSGWPARLVAAVGAALDFAAREPERARLLFLDISPADPELIPQIQASTDYMIELLRHGRGHCPATVVLPESMERVLIGGASSIVVSRLLAGQTHRLLELKPPLVQFLLTPYLGLEQAREIASTVR